MTDIDPVEEATTLSDEAIALQDEAEAENAARKAAVQREIIQSFEMAALQDEAEYENTLRDETAAGLEVLTSTGGDPILLPELDHVEGPFGPALWPALVAAGLDTLPIAVSSERVIFAPELEAADRARVMAVIEAHDPSTPAPAPVIVIDKFDFWDRMTEAEATAVEQVIAQQSVKQRRIFETAKTFRSDYELWGLLNTLADQLFTPERKAVILAPST